jgi:DNA-binding transcriptional MerR regulator
MTAKLSDYLKTADAAVVLGVSPNTIHNWGREDKIPEHRHPINNYRLYQRQDLEGLLKRLQKPSNRKTKPK